MSEQVTKLSPDITVSKNEIYMQYTNELIKRNYSIAEADFNRPWGGFIRIADKNIEQFIGDFFDGIDLPQQTRETSLSPKLLIVEPNSKLSWQVHNRRSEFWRVVYGPIGTYLSETDQHPDTPNIYSDGDTIDIGEGMRHRLVGLNDRGIVAELWIHKFPDNPSDELDIIRVSDDFGRD